MYHTIAYIVIGIVIGAALLWGRPAGSLVLGVILGLVGSFAGGELLHRETGKFGSLVAAVIGALILGFVARYIAGAMQGRRSRT